MNKTENTENTEIMEIEKQSARFDISTIKMNEILAISEVAAASNFFNETKENIAMKVLKGVELGIGPFQSITGIHVIQGKPSISSELMKAMILRNFPNAILKEVETKNGYCIVSHRGTWKQTFRFTLNDAKRANLLRKSNWKKYPIQMCRNRATSKMARTMFPDVIAGASYTREEIE